VGVATYGVTEWHIFPGRLRSAQVHISWTSALGNPTSWVPFGPVLYDAPSLESTVRRAQIAVFSPQDETHQFLTYADSLILEMHTAIAELNMYTSHVVHIIFQDPGIPLTATFVDTPGQCPIQSKLPLRFELYLIGLLSDEPDTIDVYDAMVLASITYTNTIIVAVLPINCGTYYDILRRPSAEVFDKAPHKWDRTWQLVKQADPSGCRTIGISKLFLEKISLS
jgi:hypothetical protein